MSRRAIEREDWAEFADGFSRRHDGWLVSVSVDPEDAPRRCLERDAPLQGVVVEGEGNPRSMMIITGSPGPRATHFVEHPTSVDVEETDEGAEQALPITDEWGCRTIVEFRSPMRPELVDGMT